MPNYSSLLLTQSQLQVSNLLAEKEKESQSQMQESSLSKSGLHQEIQNMLNRKSSKLSSIS